MQITLKPTSKTLNLIKKLGNSSKIVQDAKRSGLIKASNIFRLKAVKEAPIAKGTLRKSILTEVDSRGAFAKVFSKLIYAFFQEEGTGVYGKRGTPIRPKRSKFLKFTAKSGRTIFAKQVKGVKGRWFMKKGSEHLQKQTNIVSKVIFDSLEKDLK